MPLQCMKLGSFEVPEKRFVPDAIADIKKIYDAVKSDEIASKDLSVMLGYKHPTATPFYMRLNSMVAYGLLEGRGTFRVSNLGKSLAYPENEKQEKIMKSKAILNVSLWKELYQKFGKSPPADNFWVQIKNITGIEPQEAQGVEKQIRKWYIDDIMYISEDVLQSSESKTEGLTQNEPNSKPTSQQNMQTIYFDKYQISLPKGDLVKEWEKLKKYMEIKLEDYKSEQQEDSGSPKSEEQSQE